MELKIRSSVSRKVMGINSENPHIARLKMLHESLFSEDFLHLWNIFLNSTPLTTFCVIWHFCAVCCFYSSLFILYKCPLNEWNVNEGMQENGGCLGVMPYGFTCKLKHTFLLRPWKNTITWTILMRQTTQAIW